MRRIAIEVVVGAPLLAAVVLAASRVGETARFMSWPIIAFTALAAVVALVGLWVGMDRPALLAAGVLPALVLSYVLPALPVVLVTAVLVGLAVVAVRAGGIAAGMAMTVGMVMVVAVIAQGPAVECGESSVSSGSGPWWIRSPSHSSSSATGDAQGHSSGTTQVGEHRYMFACDGNRLTEFERTD